MGLFGLGKKKEDSANNELNPIKNSINIENKDMPDFSNPFNQESKETTTSLPTPNKNPFNQEPEQMPPIPKAPKNLSNNSDEKTWFSNEIKNPFNNEPNQIPPTTHSTPNNNPFNQESEQMPPIPKAPKNLSNNSEKTDFANKIKNPFNNEQEQSFMQEPSKNNFQQQPIKKEETIPEQTNNEQENNKTNENIYYLDEILDKDFNLNSDEIINKEKELIPKEEKELEIGIQETEPKKEMEEPKEIFIVENTKKDDELPEFEDEEQKLEKKTKEIVEKFKKRNEITGDIFIKTQYYKEILHAAVNLKEDVKTSNKKIEDIKDSVNSENKSDEKIKQEIEFINENLMLIEEKLFENNPYLR